MGFFICNISAISSLLHYFALGRYILCKTLVFLVLGEMCQPKFRLNTWGGLQVDHKNYSRRSLPSKYVAVVVTRLIL